MTKWMSRLHLVHQLSEKKDLVRQVHILYETHLLKFDQARWPIRLTYIDLYFTFLSKFLQIQKKKIKIKKNILYQNRLN